MNQKIRQRLNRSRQKNKRQPSIQARQKQIVARNAGEPPPTPKRKDTFLDFLEGELYCAHPEWRGEMSP